MTSETIPTAQQMEFHRADIIAPSPTRVGSGGAGRIYRPALVLALAAVLSGCETMPTQATAGYGGIILASIFQDAHNERQEAAAAEAQRQAAAEREEARSRREEQARAERRQLAEAAKVEREQRAEAERQRQAQAQMAARAEEEAERQRQAQAQAERQRRAAAARVEREQRQQREAAKAAQETARVRVILGSQMAKPGYRAFPLTNEGAAAKWVGQRKTELLKDARSGNRLRYAQNADVHDLEIRDLVGKTVTYDFQMQSVDESGVWVVIDKPIDIGERVMAFIEKDTGLKVLPIRLNMGEHIDPMFAIELTQDSKIRLSGRVSWAGYHDPGADDEDLFRAPEQRVVGLGMLVLGLSDIQVVKVSP